MTCLVQREKSARDKLVQSDKRILHSTLSFSSSTLINGFSSIEIWPTRITTAVSNNNTTHPKGGYYPQQPQQSYGGQPYGQPYGGPGYQPQPPPQTVYVQQPGQSSGAGGGTGCLACLAGACLCCCAEEALCDCLL
ncbi:hypothetical protein BD769DRAFT_1013197 [Suillus cothurnatus]|nr:hypothetical protein BD769DRAFT_1013197 [Suillus cothurnatus]